MVKKTGRRKRKKNQRYKDGKYLWLYLSILFLLITNIVSLDLLIGIGSGKHFLPNFIHAPFDSFFAPAPQRQPKAIEGMKKPAETEKKLADQKTKPDQLIQKKKKPFKAKKDRADSKPKVALVIDDLGYNPELAEELFALDFPMTVSVLPNLPHSASIARLARQRDKEVILHLPMEPYDYPNAQVEKGTLLTSMQDEEIRELIQKAIDSLGCAIGANNHMGSRMVEDEKKMCVILDEMKEKGFFFLDSRTSPGSKVFRLAKDMNVKTAKRDVFLDGHNDIDYIYKQLEEVADLANKNGYGIAIGHLLPKTIEALRRYLPELQKRGIQLVRLSEVIE